MAEPSPQGTTPPQVDSLEVQELTDTGEGQGKSLAALQRNRDKKRKRQEKQEATGEVAKRRVHFLARATLVKSEDYGVEDSWRSKSRYIGVVDWGREFTLLAGPGQR